MFKLNSKLTMACSAAVLALAMAACSSSSDDNPPVAGMNGNGTTNGPDPVLTELEMAQVAAAAAATAAMTASGDAATAAAAAKNAIANLANHQTRAAVATLAEEAAAAAYKAMAAYEAAKTAAAEAAAAEDVTSAARALVAAEAGQAAAETSATEASEKGTAAETAAMTELMIDGKTKSVGGTSITVDTPLSSVTSTVDDKSTTVVTGEIGKVTAMSAMVDAVVLVPATPNTEPPVAGVVAKPSIDARSINIGVRLDDDDDSARLTLVTHFIGTASVGGVYSGDGTAIVGGILQTEHNAYDHDKDSADDDASDTVMIKMARGMFHETTDVDIGTVTSESKSTALYYYDAPADDAEPGDPLVRTWLRRTNTQTAPDGTVTQDYNMYVADNVNAGKVNAGLANFPTKTAFKHLHYGTWNSLDDKGNAIDNLGIGFVTATADGTGMTGEDMPNVGKATYSGHWVASVREADMEGDGLVSAQQGESEMMADFVKDTVTVDLMNLAKLGGAISGDSFSGTKVSEVVAGDGGLDADGTFTGSFSGGFYGAKAAEAGGVFDFDVERNEGRARSAALLVAIRSKT